MKESSDIVVVELLKEARILKRQLQLIKNNINEIPMESLVNILDITRNIGEEIKELNENGEVSLSAGGRKEKKYM